ncbi:hypothetical protein K439DRAFT_670169 [Ramaria rubella]|nr:hypothetical protein K439DRAFT_670169 [Ramaria rubella]
MIFAHRKLFVPQTTHNPWCTMHTGVDTCYVELAALHVRENTPSVEECSIAHASHAYVSVSDHVIDVGAQCTELVVVDDSPAVGVWVWGVYLLTNLIYLHLQFQDSGHDVAGGVNVYIRRAEAHESFAVKDYINSSSSSTLLYYQ